MKSRKISYRPIIITLAATLSCAAVAIGQSTASSPPASVRAADAALKEVPVTFTGGYDTDPRDHGRPVALVAGALNVSPDVFRKAFSGVSPAPAGQQPDPAQVRLNKEALLRVLGPDNVTNDRLDEVSNYYRYRPESGQLWRHVPAQATATLRDGQLVSISLKEAGAGYSSPPRVSIEGVPNAKATVTLSFTTDLKTNGSIKSIGIEKPH